MIGPSPDKHPLRAALEDLAEVKGSGEDCIAASTIWDSAAGRLSYFRNASVIRHIGECTACAVAWELARDLDAAEEATTIVRRRYWPLAAAAVLAIAVTGLWFYESRQAAAPPPTYRDAAQAWLVSEIPPDRALSRENCVLRWTAGPDGTTYDVKVTSDSLQPLARAWRLEAAEYRVDPSDLQSLPSGATILWRVTAHLPGGRDVVSLTFVHPVE